MVNEIHRQQSLERCFRGSTCYCVDKQNVNKLDQFTHIFARFLDWAAQKRSFRISQRGITEILHLRFRRGNLYVCQVVLDSLKSCLLKRKSLHAGLFVEWSTYLLKQQDVSV